MVMSSLRILFVFLGNLVRQLGNNETSPGYGPFEKRNTTSCEPLDPKPFIP